MIRDVVIRKRQEELFNEWMDKKYLIQHLAEIIQTPCFVTLQDLNRFTKESHSLLTNLKDLFDRTYEFISFNQIETFGK